MTQKISANTLVDSLHIALVIGRFNSFINEQLRLGAVDTFVRHGGHEDQLTEVWVPGAFEIPLICKKLALTEKYDAIVALGTVIRGGTPHFDYISSEVTKGVGSLGLETMTPISFGVLTTDSIDQAIERAGTKAGNKGAEAMLAAIETANLLRMISL